MSDYTKLNQAFEAMQASETAYHRKVIEILEGNFSVNMDASNDPLPALRHEVRATQLTYQNALVSFLGGMQLQQA